MFDHLQVSSHLIPTDPRFGCGPSLVPMEFLQSLLDQGPHYMGTSHRKSAVRNVVKEIQEGLPNLLSIPAGYQVVMGNGGATAVFDMVACGLVEKKIAHYTCGEFSEKWYKSSKLYPGIEAMEFKAPYGEGINPQVVDGADVITGTLNETSTGVMLSALPTVNENVLLAIDATSGAGQIPCDLKKVDVFFFAPQKVFASDGGLWVAIMSPKALQRARTIAAQKGRYIPPILNWSDAIDNGEKNQTYNTPALSTLWMFNEQIKRMNKMGFARVVEEAQAKANHLYQWAEQKDYLTPFVRDPQHRSLTTACIDVKGEVKADDIANFLEKKKWVYGIDSYRKLGKNQFRISLFHNIPLDNLQRLTQLLSLLIEGKK